MDQTDLSVPISVIGSQINLQKPVGRIGLLFKYLLINWSWLVFRSWTLDPGQTNLISLEGLEIDTHTAHVTLNKTDESRLDSSAEME